MMNPVIELLSEKSVPYSEICKSLPARSDHDCFTAWSWLLELGAITDELSHMIADSADKIRDAQTILRMTDRTIRKGFQELPEPIPAQHIEWMMELHALTVEAYVRTANKAFPIHGNN